MGGQSSAVPVSELAPPPIARSVPQVRIRYAINGSALIAFNAGDTLNLNEGDALTLDASNSLHRGRYRAGL